MTSFGFVRLQWVVLNIDSNKIQPKELNILDLAFEFIDLKFSFNINLVLSINFKYISIDIYFSILHYLKVKNIEYYIFLAKSFHYINSGVCNVL